jgi:hypothetical protein
VVRAVLSLGSFLGHGTVSSPQGRGWNEEQGQVTLSICMDRKRMGDIQMDGQMDERVNGCCEVSLVDNGDGLELHKALQRASEVAVAVARQQVALRDEHLGAGGAHPVEHHAVGAHQHLPISSSHTSMSETVTDAAEGKCTGESKRGARSH